MKSIEVTGRTEDEAVEAALAELGLARDDVSVEIVERAKAGFLGIGSTPATVRIFYGGEDEPDSNPAPDTAGSAASEDAYTPDDISPDVKADEAPNPAPDGEAAPTTKGERSPRADTLDTFLSGLLERMGVHATMEISQTETDLSAVITCQEQGVLVGKNGEVLEALLHISSFVVNKERPRIRVSVDTENYRQRRDDEQASLARSTAEQARKTRRNIRLEPMNAYERHVVHEALQGSDNISTYSIGDEPRRRVVVCYGRGGERNTGF
jgi:spoIIIJ-associated protein